MAKPNGGDAPPVTKPRSTRTEKLLVLLALQIVVILGYSYFADIPLKDLFHFGQSSDQNEYPIGTATVVEGQVMRRRAKEAAFKPLLESAVIYPNDTVMTGPDSLCIIVLKNGRTIRITANSLVQLTYNSAMAKNGINVDVLRGSVQDETALVPLQGKPAAPVGAPAPAVPSGLPPLAVLGVSTLPAAKEALSFSDDEFVRRKKPVKVSARINRAGAIRFELYLDEPATKKRIRVASVAPEVSSDLNAAVTFEFERPGHYEWQVVDEYGSALSTHTLILRPEVLGLRMLPSLDASDRIEGQAAKNDFAGPLLRWAPEEGPGAYRVRVFAPGHASPVVHETLVPELRVDPREFRLDQPLRYSVEKEVEGGFLLSTGPQRLTFELSAPSLKAPSLDAVVDAPRLGGEGDAIFFSWTKTNFTTAYEFVLDTKSTFASPLIQKSVHDNFNSIRTPAPGHYYWRVRSMVQGVWTPYSEPRGFTVQSSN